MSRPLDARLLSAAPALRRYLLVLAGCQLIGALMIVAQAGLLASILVRVFTGHVDGAALLQQLLLLGCVGLVRAGSSAVQEYSSARASVRVRAQLRGSALRAIANLGPTWGQRQPSGRLVNATGPGLDALEGYLTRALPALVGATVVPPIVLVRIGVADWQSGLLLLFMLPLVPVFMALVGMTTRRRIERQYLLLARLSGHFLDLLRGLTTLRVYGQAARQERSLRRATEQYRQQSMSALRVALLSALVLDLVAALSVAVVAVDVGLRLDGSALSFTTALVVLLLAPELFAPLRALGVAYHANQEGATAAGAALDIVDEAHTEQLAHELPAIELPAAALPAVAPVPFAPDGTYGLDGVTVRYPGRDDAALDKAFFAVASGEIVALTGRSGSGKSTMLSVFSGLVMPDDGRVVAGSAGELVDAATLPVQQWRAGVAWLPQRPMPTQRTVADEVRLGDPDAGEAELLSVCQQCATPSPQTTLGEDGRAVSAGQRRRIALARVLLRVEACQRRGVVPLVLLDEPSEDLDRDTELVVASVISALAGRATVLLATHSEVLAALADRRLDLVDGRLAEVTEQPGAGSLRVKAVSMPVAAVAEAVGQAQAPAAVHRQAVPARRWIIALARTEGMGGRLLQAAALSALGGLTALALTGTSIWLISRAAEHPNVQALALAVVGVRTFAIGRALLRYAERLQAHDVALRLLVALRAKVFGALIPLGPAALGGYRRGDLLRRFVGDVDGLQDGLVRAFVPLSRATVTGLGACLLAGLLVPAAGVILLSALLITGLLIGLLTRRSTVDADPAVALAGQRDERTSAMIDGLSELTAYGAVDRAVAEIALLDADLSRRTVRLARAATAGTVASAVIAAITLPVVLLTGADAVHAGRLSAISLGVLAVCVLAGFEAVAPLPSAFVAWTRCAAGLRRVASVLASTPAMIDPAESVVPPTADVGVQAQLVQVRPTPYAEPVVRGADLVVAAGRRVALTGPSGCGKSTVLAAVLRQLRLDDGVIELTSGDCVVDLSAIRAADLPPAVAGSLQGDHVFDVSLRDNLLVVRPDADLAALTDVARRCGLTEFIADLPDGWSTPAGVDGSQLSGGQRQRLLLARALLADPAVLVLDEPTAHLDAVTEQAVLADLLDATSGRTVLLSTHRRIRADQIDSVLRFEGDTLEEDKFEDGHRLIGAAVSD